MIGRRVMRRRVVRGAVVAGGAYAVGKRVQRGRDEDAAAQEYAGAEEEYVEEPQTGLTDDTVAQLEQLAQLKKDGILTEEEFAEQKARILGG